MATSRSFTEYVKNKLDNKLWAALEQFFHETDPSALDLRLSKVTDIGEVELDDTDLVFVDVFDLPGSAVAFNVVLNASIIVHDIDRYHNDQTDYTHQWFVLKCRGDLACNLADMVIGPDIQVYSSRDRQRRPMSDSLVPVIKKEQLEQEATEFLRRHYKKALLQPMWVDPMELAAEMKLAVVKQRITEDCTVFGQIYFKDTDATVYDEDQGCEALLPVKQGTIVVDPDVAFQRNLGAFNNTIVHECVHWDLHKKAFELERLFNDDASQIKCKVVGGIAGRSTEATKWMEWQANALAPRIQMPYEMFKRKASELIRKYRDKLGIYELCELMPFVIEELSTFFMVSRTAAKLRMMDIGYEEAAGTFIYIDGQYVKPHSYKRGALKQNQTYSIPAQDAAIQTLTNPALKNSDKYVYIDSHFVLNHPRYVYQDETGNTLMTDYARYHVDECCLAFDMSLRIKVEEYYHRECFLNRDKGAPLDFDMVYTGEYKELDDARRAKMLQELVMEEAQVLDSLPNNYTAAWKALLKWRHISQAELARRTGLTEKTIGNIINQETTGTLNNVLLMCLGANLPWDMSNFILSRSGHQLLLVKEDHIWYSFCLKNMYTKSINEIQDFLFAHGAAPL